MTGVLSEPVTNAHKEVMIVFIDKKKIVEMEGERKNCTGHKFNISAAMLRLKRAITWVFNSWKDWGE